MDKPWKVIAAFVGVFAFGSIFGGLLALRFFDHDQLPRRQPPQFRGQGGGGGGRPEILSMFTERLSLTSAQLEKIRPLVERAEDDFRRRRQTEFRETGVIFERLHQDIVTFLTPEQQVKLEKIKERQGEKLRDGPPMGGGGRGGRRPGPASENPGPIEPGERTGK